jgi:hypothetical protein
MSEPPKKTAVRDEILSTPKIRIEQSLGGGALNESVRPGLITVGLSWDSSLALPDHSMLVASEIGESAPRVLI